MSYWVYLKENGETVSVDNHSEGGTCVVGGTCGAELNVTYNYSRVYRLVDFNLQQLHGKVARETSEALACAVEKLGTRQHNDYWAPTPGNAGYAARILLRWALQHPFATWEVS